jgi:hypothetical protein
MIAGLGMARPCYLSPVATLYAFRRRATLAEGFSVWPAARGCDQSYTAPRDGHQKLQDGVNIRSENGHPSNCYQMALTKDGSDVKSVIVSELTRAFGDASEPTAERTLEKPSTKKSQEQLSRARYPKSAALISGQ